MESEDLESRLEEKSKSEIRNTLLRAAFKTGYALGKKGESKEEAEEMFEAVLSWEPPE